MVVTLGDRIAFLKKHPMKRHFLLPLVALFIAASSFAQTKINFSDVRGLDGRDSLQGTDATIQLDKTEGDNGVLLINTEDVTVKVNAKLVNHHSPTSSANDPGEDLALDIIVTAGTHKGKRHVVLPVSPDKDRSGWLREGFIFSLTRTISVFFTYTIE